MKYFFLRDYSTHSADRNMEVKFQDIEETIVSLLDMYDVAVGAVAWLTSPAILAAMSRRKHIAVVVQKEDFLRRDTGEVFSLWKKRLQSNYAALKPFDTWDFCETYPGQQEGNPAFNHAVQDWLFDFKGSFQRGGDGVRCLGYAPNGGKATPRMHHKFLVLGWMQDGLILNPDCVVTGSFNMTSNAVRSRENILIVNDEAICHAYLSEWAQLWCMSETTGLVKHRARRRPAVPWVVNTVW